MTFNQKEFYKKYYEKNKEKNKARSKKYYEENKEKIRIKARKWREENKEHLKEYKEKNKEKIKATRKKYYEKNKERLNAKVRKWHEENKEYSKIYYQSNKEYHAEVNKKYREKHKVRLNKLNSEINKKAWGDFNSPFWFSRRCSVIKARARAKELDFNLDAEYLKSIFPKDKRCPALGIPFKVLDIHAKGKELQQKVSLDRIDSSKGYVKGNVQWVSLLANAIMTNATPDQVIQVGHYFKKVTEDLNRNNMEGDI